MSTLATPPQPKGPASPSHVLDNAAWAALTGPHAAFAERVGRAAVELGTYPGLRHRGRLIAMAGERSEMGVPRPEAGGGCARPAGPRSALSALTRTTAAGGWPPGWCAPSRRASGSVETRPSRTPPRTTPVRSGCTSPSASPCAAAGTSSWSELPAQGRNRRRSRAVEMDDDTKTARPGARRAGRAEVTEVPGVSRLPAKVLAPRRRVHLYSRPHIDLQRVAGALCRS